MAAPVVFGTSLLRGKSLVILVGGLLQIQLNFNLLTIIPIFIVIIIVIIVVIKLITPALLPFVACLVVMLDLRLGRFLFCLR